MSDTILLKRNSSTGHMPTTGQMAVGESAVNTFDGKFFIRGNNGADFVKEIGALAQRGLVWDSVSGLAPLGSYEFDALSYLFAQGSSQALVAFFRVPNSYTPGTQIFLRQAVYTQGVANNFKMQTVATLIRKAVDAINSTTNQKTSTNADQAIPTTAYQYLENIFDLTDTAGKINNVAVSPNDIIKIVISRVATNGTDDANDVRLLNNSTEILF